MQSKVYPSLFSYYKKQWGNAKVTYFCINTVKIFSQYKNLCDKKSVYEMYPYNSQQISLV